MLIQDVQTGSTHLILECELGSTFHAVKFKLQLKKMFKNIFVIQLMNKITYFGNMLKINQAFIDVQARIKVQK